MLAVTGMVPACISAEGVLTLSYQLVGTVALPLPNRPVYHYVCGLRSRRPLAGLRVWMRQFGMGSMQVHGMNVYLEHAVA